MLPYWYELAGVQSDDPARQIDSFTRAVAEGYLGVAVGNPRRKNFDVIMDLDPRQWYYARMSVRVLKLNGQTIGMLVMGSHWRLWKMLDGRMAQGPSAAGGLSREFADFLVTVLSMSKIHVLAVHPNQQGRGYGQRLLRDAVHIGRSDGLNMLYGMFQSDRPHLRGFYQSGGFEVLDPGEPLTLYAATGNTDDAMVPEPNES